MKNKEPFSIRQFLCQGVPDGVISVDIPNWSGNAIKAPRTQLDFLLGMNELKYTGVYILTGLSETGGRSVYIGQGQLGKRIIAHSKDPKKDFWDTVIIFSSGKDNLSSADTLYLESKLIELAEARENKQGDLKVTNRISAQKHTLSDRDSADMNIFLNHILLILDILQIQDFKQLEDTSQTGNGAMLYMKEARGILTNKGFILLKDSVIAGALQESASSYQPLFTKIIEDKSILVERDGGYVLLKDYEFNSPSAAATLVCGSPRNGREAWRDSQGRSIKDRERDLIAKDNEPDKPPL